MDKLFKRTWRLRMMENKDFCGIQLKQVYSNLKCKCMEFWRASALPPSSRSSAVSPFRTCAAGMWLVLVMFYLAFWWCGSPPSPPQRPELGSLNTVQHNHIEKLQTKGFETIESRKYSAFYSRENVKIILFLIVFSYVRIRKFEN